MDSYPIDTLLYPLDLIEQGIQDFKDYSSLSFEGGKLSIDSGEDTHEIYREFMNYLIGLHNQS